jgi:hypothetical protein
VAVAVVAVLVALVAMFPHQAAALVAMVDLVLLHTQLGQQLLQQEFLLDTQVVVQVVVVLAVLQLMVAVTALVQDKFQ